MMKTSDDQRRLLELCAISKLSWNLVAREAQRPDGLSRLVNAELTEHTEQAATSKALILQAKEAPEAGEERVLHELELVSDDVRLTTVLDDDYPANLRSIFNLPPFLFYRGHLAAEDARSVAVVGTRHASPDGLMRAAQIAAALADNGVTVLSGLAAGVDAAAHRATLEAGGRTIAVFGTGITQVYPKKNTDLAREIVDQGGAAVSQFWPSASPTKYNFPLRNITTSGMSQGTVVVEASGTSGARNQARRALEHGKKVFLIRELVTREEWARDYVERGALEVDGVDEILEQLRPAEEIELQSQGRRQLALDFS